METLQILTVDQGGVLKPAFFDKIPSLKKEVHFSKGADVAADLAKSPPDLVCLSLDALEHLDTLMAWIEEVKEWDDGVPIFVFSRVGGVKEAVSVMARRVSGYFLEPFDAAEVGRSLESAVRLYHLTRRIFLSDQGGAKTDLSFEGMIAISPKMRENFQIISAVAKSNATVLIMGSSGTGKELVAKAIHRQSTRARNRFVDLNCGAIPKDLLENELFGHERGAFTGADRRYEGSFEVADKGTLFLDEISEMDPLLQVKLLRVLQERSFSRIGGRDKIEVDVRIVAATNRKLEEEVKKGGFREDLYYRLNVIPIYLPALKERREDIPLLAKHFLDKFCSKNSRIFLDFSEEALEALVNYDWPGNVRELENAIERIVVLHDDSTVKLKHLPAHLQAVERKVSWHEVHKVSSDKNDKSDKGEKEVLAIPQAIVPLEDLEKEAIERAFAMFQGNIVVMAKKLKISQATLYRKVKKFGLIGGK